jgi:hypothetical protein
MVRGRYLKLNQSGHGHDWLEKNQLITVTVRDCTAGTRHGIAVTVH